MKRFALGAAVLASACAAVASVDLEKDVWLLADFDSQTRVSGKAFFHALDARGFKDGRFGQGYHFFRDAGNRLPPVKQLYANSEYFQGDGLTFKEEGLVFAGGEFVLTPPTTTGVGYHWVGHDGANTWSVYVKGQKGTKVTLTPEVTPIDPKDVANAKKKADWKYEEKNIVADKTVPGEITLSGDWDRVACHLVMDNRTSAKRKPSLRVKADGEVEMTRFQLQVTGVFPFKNRFEPGVWVDGGTKAKGEPILVRDAELMENFPAMNGSCAFWVKNAPGVPPATLLNLWSVTRPWTSHWGLENNAFHYGDKMPALSIRAGVPRRDEWTHVACTWREGRVAYFVNGKLEVEHVPNEKKRVKEVKIVPPYPGSVLRVGAFGDGTGPTDAILDEFAIFNRTLDDAEIAELAAAKTALAAGTKQVLAENILFKAFFRDDKDARLRFRVAAPEACDYTLVSEVGGVKGAPRKVSLPKGESYLEVPLDPAQFRPGDYPFSFALKDAKGAVALTVSDTLRIHGRLGDDPFIFHSWGGSNYAHPEFMKEVGVNAYNVNHNNPLEIRKALNFGFMANLRYEWQNGWFDKDFDWTAVRAKVAADLEFARALPNWRSTLLNSEVYGSGGAKRAEKNPKYLALVEKAIGVKPDFTYEDAPSAISYGRLGLADGSLYGEIDHTACPTLETLNYVVGSGLPVILGNYEMTKAIHSVKDVTVWSEPMWGGLADSVDMGADWEYEYSTRTTLHQLRAHYAPCRRYGKPYMPTLGGGYWPEQKGEHPTRKDKDGKPERFNLGQGADEVAIKTWLSLGAVPAHNLSWFALDCWEYGISNALALAASPTNAVKNVAEPDCARRFAAAWRKDLAPAADLLRDMPNVRAPVAYLQLPEIDHAGRFWWGSTHYRNAILKAMTEAPVAFDKIGSAELLSGEAAKYKYIMYPMSRIVYKDHATALRKAADAGVKIILDKYATNHYANCILATNMQYKATKYKEMNEMVHAVYDGIAEKLAQEANVISPATDAKTSFTFEKTYKGARYVVVINDLRDQKPSYLNTFKTNDWYRVVGAPQQIETVVRDFAPGSAVYLYNANGRKTAQDKKGTEVRLAAEYGPAEGRVYCIYPRPLKAPELSFEGTARPGKTVTLVVRINDKAGSPAPGRQVVTLTLTDSDGVVRDESGRYVVEDGVVRIPIRIAHDDKPTGMFSKWKAEVTDLTTGKAEHLALAVTNDK